MPITSGNGQFSVGRDTTVVLIGPFGRVDIPNVTGFDCKQQTANIKVDRLDGVQMNAELPKGWGGTLDLERGSVGVEQMFALAEQAWYLSGSYTVSQLYQYITEADGSTSTFMFTNVALSLTEAGSWKGDASVKQTIAFMADRRVQM